VVLAERAMRDCEWLVREAGAVYFTSSPRNLVPLAGLAVRFLATAKPTATRIPDAIWSRLPWGN